jgi:hypothetical protein
MAFRLPSRPVFAAGLAIVIALGPAIAALGGQVGSSVPRTLADPAGCTNTGTKHSPSIQCAPSTVPGLGSGLPNEQQLTDQNSHRK